LVAVRATGYVTLRLRIAISGSQLQRVIGFGR
jgi:hypothetical protein